MVHQENRCVIQRKTQTADYWQSFALAPEDIEAIRDQALEAERPLSLREVAHLVVAERCRREEGQLRAELARGTLYQPKNRYAVGDRVIFPELDFRMGEVTDVRPGANPEYGGFEVIAVDFGQGRRPRSFAAALASPHKLNADLSELMVEGDLASPERLIATVASGVPEALEVALEEEQSFAGSEGTWLPRVLLADIHIGHLNIAEALIEMRGSPIETSELVKEMDLPSEIQPGLLAFSLMSAMASDGRFDQVGAGNTRAWFLRRLEPSEAAETPELLRYVPEPFDEASLSDGLRQLAWELDDEWSLSAGGSPAREALNTATLLLTHPHLASGSLPLNRHSRAIFPTGLGERTMVTLIDGRWGNRFQAWVVREGRYVAGLRGWFEKHKLPAGAIITLERRPETGEIVVDFRPKRMRREWTRWAQVTPEGLLDVQLRKQEVSCEYDEDLIIGDDRSAEMVSLRSSAAYRQMPLQELVFEVFTDLAGLSQSGNVHAKTIYSTVNVVRRCTPEPIFATLADDTRLVALGDSFRLAV
jgi:hypothetical protein